jgi:hypothetical protein
MEEKGRVVPIRRRRRKEVIENATRICAVLPLEFVLRAESEGHGNLSKGLRSLIETALRAKRDQQSPI